MVLIKKEQLGQFGESDMIMVQIEQVKYNLFFCFLQLFFAHNNNSIIKIGALIYMSAHVLNILSSKDKLLL